MAEELTDIEQAEVEEADTKKIVNKIAQLMPQVAGAEIEKWAKLSMATDEQVAELTKLKLQETKAARAAQWAGLGKEN